MRGPVRWFVPFCSTFFHYLVVFSLFKPPPNTILSRMTHEREARLTPCMARAFCVPETQRETGTTWNGTRRTRTSRITQMNTSGHIVPTPRTPHGFVSFGHRPPASAYHFIPSPALLECSQPLCLILGPLIPPLCSKCSAELPMPPLICSKCKAYAYCVSHTSVRSEQRSR